jgi:hypothetical protein
MIAQHVICRATRDALFLSHFSASRLPIVMTVGSVLSGVGVVVFTRLIARFGPALVVPGAFVLHAIAMTIEWALSLRFEAAAAIVVYLHTASLGATILSAFWSVVTEGFDPYTAKRAIGQIGTGAALGGVLGGGLAWGGSRLTSVPVMLLAGAALSLVCAWGARVLGRRAAAGPKPLADKAIRASGFAALRETPYLRVLALLVLFGALLQSLLDFAFGAQAKATYGSGAHLLSFFALFQTAIGVLSFLLQTVANQPALDRLGLGGTLALLPVGVAGFGALALGMPSLATTALQRGTEGVLRASLFRSAYEVLFTPVPQSLKRPTKTIIDVTFDRVGGLTGGGLTLALIVLWPHAALSVVTATSVVVAALQLAIAYRLHHDYVAILAERLRSGALELDPASIVDRTTRNTLSRTFSSIDRATLLAKIEALRIEQGTPGIERRPVDTTVPSVPDLPVDEVAHAMTALRALSPSTIREALQREGVGEPLLAPQMLELLSHDEVARDAMRALAPIAPRIVGTILDVVLDEQRPPRMRRRAARLLRTVPSQRAADGLVLGLSSKAFDVRHACGRILVGMREDNGDLHFDAAMMFQRAKRELESPSRDERFLEHVFDVLSLTAPLEELQLAYGALQSPDAFLRGIALEYLDVVLPSDVRAAMMARLAAPLSRPVPRRPKEGALEDLMKSKQAIQLHLDELRRARDPDADPSGSG